MNYKIALAAALLLSLSAAPDARAQKIISDLNVVANENADKFDKRADQIYKLGDWIDLQRVGRARRVAHPSEAKAWAAEGLGAYANGDIDAAIVAYEGRLRLGPNAEAETNLANARAVRRKYPDLQLKPIEFVKPKESSNETMYHRQFVKLLASKDYEGIERLAAELQQSNESDTSGYAMLQEVFHALSSRTKNPQARLAALQDWQKSRPNSVLPRLVLIDYWVNMAWLERGGGMGSSITPEMSRKMETNLDKAAQIINELPAQANESPLMFIALQNWAQLSGAGRPFMDAVFREGEARFPYYVPLYHNRTVLLLPRWFGSPGEWEAMAAEHADQIGGEKGDIIYAQIFINGYRYTDPLLVKGDVQADRSDYLPRFWRGLAAMRAAQPDSVELRTRQILISDLEARLPTNSRTDLERAQSGLLEPDGHILDETVYGLSLADFKRQFPMRRMEILAADRKGNW